MQRFMGRFVKLIPLLLLYFYSASAFSGPVIYFSDLNVAPNTGWSAADPNKGAVVTIWGKGFGSERGASFVIVNGEKLTANSDYPETWGEFGKPVPFLQRITFQLNASVPLGAGSISVFVKGSQSNAIDFSVNQGRIVFVDVNASGTGNGSLTSPWSDPGDFMNAMQPGDVAYFRAGLYNEKYNGGKSVMWFRDTETHGQPGAPIALVAYPNEEPVFDSWTNGNSNFKNSIRLSASYFTVSKMKILGYSNAVSGSDYARIVGNDLIGGRVLVDGNGIVEVGDNGAVIYGNNIHGGRSGNRLDHAAYITGCAPIEGNEMAWNYMHDNSFDRGPIVVVNHQENRCPSNVHVKSHFIHHNVVDCSDYPSRGIGLFDQSWDGGGETEPEPSYVYGNIVIECGISGYTSMYQNAAHGRWYNNTIYNSRESAFSISGSRVISSEVVNNIITLQKPSSDYIGDIEGASVVTNNLYFGAGAYSGTDPNGINADPKMIIDVLLNNFKLEPDSPAINAGAAPLDFNTLDINGIGRSIEGNADMGAIEYRQASPSSPSNTRQQPE